MKLILCLLISIVLGYFATGCRMAGNTEVVVRDNAGPVIVLVANRTDQNAEKTLTDWLKGNKADVPLIP